MNRRSLLDSAAVLFTSAALTQCSKGGSAPVNPSYEMDHERALKMNEAAGNIRSIADARKFVDMVDEVFAGELPPAWSTQILRAEIAKAEYDSVATPTKLIPEQRLVDVWNRYVERIAAPQQVRVTAEEIHNLRDAHYASARVLWNQGSQTIWTMPDIYPVQSDGRVAYGCRAIDALRIIWDLSNLPDNLQATRERVHKGILFSDQIKRSQEQAISGARSQGWVVVRGGPNLNSIYAAERLYIRNHGKSGVISAGSELINALILP